MTYLDKLLAAPPSTLALVAIVLMALAIAFLVTRGRRVTVGLGSILALREGKETLSPAAATFIDARIEHKWKGIVSEPFLRLTAEYDRLKRWVGRLDREREDANEKHVRLEARLENLEKGQERMEEKLDRLIERRS